LRAPRSAALKSLELRDTGERESIAESPRAGIALEGGWYAIADNDCSLIADASFDRLSAGRELVSC
jgi:hypothetical protein